MKSIIVTGHFGLVGSYVSEVLSSQGFNVIGIDCDVRSRLFSDLSPLTSENIKDLNDTSKVSDWFNVDIRDYDSVFNVISKVAEKNDLIGVVHCAAQPSHDWATNNPLIDLNINLKGSVNICESLRQINCLDAIFIHFSTNKVYGDTPNHLPLIEQDTRYEIREEHQYTNGIDTSMSIDNSLHSFFGCSKTAADLYIQEYSRCFGLKSVILRGGCLTGARHRGAKLHGFMNYLIKCAVNHLDYEVMGYKGKQVRDNLHAKDIGMLVYKIISKELNGEKINYPVVSNLGGGRLNSCSIIELIEVLDKDFSIPLKYCINPKSRLGDHIWYISDNTFLNEMYNWSPTTSLKSIVQDIVSSV